jgi:hypothetical protein
MADDDPRAKWRQLPEPVRLEDTAAEKETTTHDSTTDADDDGAQRELRWLLERGGGMA